MQATQAESRLTRVHLAPGVIEIAMKIQSGALRKIEVTEDMVGETLHSANSVILIPPRIIQDRNPADVLEKQVISVFQKFPSIEMSLKDVKDILSEQMASETVGNEQISDVIKKLVDDGVVTAQTAGDEDSYCMHEQRAV